MRKFILFVSFFALSVFPHGASLSEGNSNLIMLVKEYVVGFLILLVTLLMERDRLREKFSQFLLREKLQVLSIDNLLMSRYKQE